MVCKVILTFVKEACVYGPLVAHEIVRSTVVHVVLARSPVGRLQHFVGTLALGLDSTFGKP